MARHVQVARGAAGIAAARTLSALAVVRVPLVPAATVAAEVAVSLLATLNTPPEGPTRSSTAIVTW